MKPFKSLRRNASVSEQRRKWNRLNKAHFVAAAIVAVSVVYNLPHFFEYWYDWDKRQLASTPLRDSEIYSIVYTTVVDLMVRILIPSAVMIYTNASIARALRANDLLKKTERSFTLTTIILGAIFVVSNVFFFTYNIARHVVGKCRHGDTDVGDEDCEQTGRERLAMSVVDVLSRLFKVMNCSVNFFVYFFIGHKFRDTLIELLTRYVSYRNQ